MHLFGKELKIRLVMASVFWSIYTVQCSSFRFSSVQRKMCHFVKLYTTITNAMQIVSSFRGPVIIRSPFVLSLPHMHNHLHSHILSLSVWCVHSMMNYWQCLDNNWSIVHGLFSNTVQTRVVTNDNHIGHRCRCLIVYSFRILFECELCTAYRWHFDTFACTHTHRHEHTDRAAAEGATDSHKRMQG